MTKKDRKNLSIIYRKLVRDKIPEIIRKHGKGASTRILDAEEFKTAVGEKILEEAYELYSQWKNDDRQEILKESADVLEIMLTALELHEFDLNDLLAKRRKRAEQRGGFTEKIFLENVGKASSERYEFQDHPAMIFSPAQKNKMVSLIKSELAQSEKAWIASAFYSPGITNLLVSDFIRFTENGGELRLLLLTMGNAVRPEYFTHLPQFVPEINLRVFHPPDVPFDQSPPDFHLKAYLFRLRNGSGSLLIGSSNFTEAGFNRNIEWNYYSHGEVNLPFDKQSPFETALAEFERYWENESVEITEAFLNAYETRWAGWQVPKPVRQEIFERTDTWGRTAPEPNDAQKEALENLGQMRDQGIDKASVIAATGVGKTYLAAFDFKQSDCKRLLFIAHRENILNRAMQSFREVLNNDDFGVILGGGNAVRGGSPSVFAMVQTLSRKAHLEKFSPHEFDYVVVDEFHHSEAASYKRILGYFKPKFFLGLTATPERTDGRDVLGLCDYNVAYEVRLLDAVNRGWLVPFQYYAVYDETDYERMTWRGTHYDEEELTQALANDTRTAIVAHNLKKFLPSSGKIKALAFCSSVVHARYTAKKLTGDHGAEAVALVGDTPELERIMAIQKLRDEKDPLEVICTVDIFNEGTDIPDLTHVLLLRPTQSFTVFLQQLGRGLRLAPDKDYLIVIDFVGNFRKAHVAPMALAGCTSAEQFFKSYKTNHRRNMGDLLPEGCFLDADTEVRRIWDDEIKRIMGRMSPDERLRALYLDIRDDLGDKSPTLTDFLANTHGADPYVFIKHFGGWLRARAACEEELPEAEARLLNTPGEAFLKYVETGLSPSKSYKMVVLLTVLNLPGMSWKSEDIAKGFLEYFLAHKDRISDYDDLAKFPEPENFPLSKVVSHISRMPLRYLSNTDKDCFIFERERGRMTSFSRWSRGTKKMLIFPAGAIN
ncbi:DEAD/DEAH box helicase family protein [Desulfonema magnum]|uniref:Type III endonuclease, res subunit n=1 Tax=Desulfonema magnum TaxID=45655 RepID=A0A975GQA2_9BACT|nr:DEAD/DEAH box helicase family protein [Desulfonema magnum]QTA89685.1 Putative Type III endonuclease, res subunit [Desulfonema magnum]